MTRVEEAALNAYPPETKKIIQLLPKDWNKPYRDVFRKGYEQAEKDLGWISVKERLPGPSDCVVACVEVDGICTCLTLATYNEATKEWHTDNWIDGEQEVYYPDYWMPIPTKVKKDEK